MNKLTVGRHGVDRNQEIEEKEILIKVKEIDKNIKKPYKSKGDKIKKISGKQ